jgi:hypothetical protein
MSCPQCTDFFLNSEKYAVNKISGEISTEADNFARKMALGEQNQEIYIDYYIMYYRIEYTRLFNSRKAEAVESYKSVILPIYLHNTLLCKKCNIENIYKFDDSAKFCFHKSTFDVNCDNCKDKNNAVH